MRVVITGLLVLLHGGVSPDADDTKSPIQKPDAQRPRAERLKDAFREVIEQGEKHHAVLDAAKNASKTPQDLKPVWEKLTRPHAEKLLAIAEEDPRDDVGLDAATMAFELSIPDDVLLEKARSLIVQYHAGNPRLKLRRVPLDFLAGRSKEADRDFLKAVLRTNPERELKGFAAFKLAQTAQGDAERATTQESDILGKQKEALDYFEMAVREFGDVQLKNPLGKIADLARPRIDALKNSPIGKPAREIEGTDLDNKAFKLTDYRGKVILLDFWGTWCGPCMAMAPRNRETVDRLRGRPFALIGVNSDKDRAEAKTRIAKEKINWRSFWDGEMGAKGPIATVWEIELWPTLYLIDQEGIIRRMFVGSSADESDLNRLIDELVTEADEQRGKIPSRR